MVDKLEHSTQEQKVPGLNPDTDMTDLSNPTQVFHMGTLHIGQWKILLEW